MHDKDILDSWKEIASYLRRSERTCRRWEKEFGLPIYRMDGSPRASVFAYKKELDRWMDEMLREREISSRKSFSLSRKNLLLILEFSIIAVFILALVIWKVLSPKTAMPPSSGKPSLAILYFKNNTGEESLDYWRRALCDLLINDLSQSRYLNVLPEDRLFYILKNLGLLESEDYSTEDLAKLASQAQVENILLGNFVKAGGIIRINASLRKISTDEAIVLDSVDAENESEIFSMVDELSRKIKTKLELSPNELRYDLDEETERITTNSVEAYKYYTEGRSHYRAGRAQESVPFFEKAIDIDPEFAMAYRILAMSYGALPGYEDKAKNCMKRAFELSQHVSERERLLIQAHYYRSQSERTWNKAIEILQELLRIYPDEHLAIVHLGALYSLIEDWEKAAETLKKITHIHYYSSHFARLRRVLCAQGNYEEAREVAERIPIEVFPLHYPIQITLNYFFQRQFDLATREVEKILARNPEFPPGLMLRGDIYLCKEDWAQAEKDYKKCLDPKSLSVNTMEDRYLGLMRIASLYLSLGKFERAIDCLKQGVEELTTLDEKGWLFDLYLRMAYTRLRGNDIKGAMRECQNSLDISLGIESVRRKIKALHLKALIFMELKDMDEASKVADEIKIEVEGWLNPKLIRYYHHLMGRIELEKDNITDAIAHFEKATALLPYQYDPDGGNEHALFYEALALAFYEAEDLKRAQKWYENTISLTLGRIHYGDIYARSFYMLGKIYEQKGRQGKAIENYEKFLELWKDVAPGIPEVEETKQHLIALQS